jgi:hypothetical protein
MNTPTGSETCLGPWPCPGCATEITARELACQTCWLEGVQPATRFLIWKSKKVPKILAEAYTQALEQLYVMRENKRRGCK